MRREGRRETGNRGEKARVWREWKKGQRKGKRDEKENKSVS